MSSGAPGSPRGSARLSEPSAPLPTVPSSDGHSHLFFFGTEKAGMSDEYLSKEQRDNIVYQLSKNSQYFQHANKLADKNKSRTEDMLSKLSSMTDAELNKCRKQYESAVIELESNRNMRRICCVIDMDAFFAQVEIRDAPHLKDLPVAIGGMSMISTSNYIARKFGVRSAMPGFIAKKLCPDLIFVECNYEKYKTASLQAQEIIRQYDANYIHEFGLDEFYVDITDFVHQRSQSALGVDQRSQSALGVDSDGSDVDIFQLRSTAESVVTEIRWRITERTGGLTCSAGIANNFFLAKIGADQNKPNGQFSLPPVREEIMSFIRALPCRKVGGIGKVTEKLLCDLGMRTMGEVAERLPSLYFVFSPKMSGFLTRTCLGISSDEASPCASSILVSRHEMDGRVIKHDIPKHMSLERTFSSTDDCNILYDKLFDICNSLVPKVHERGLKPRTATLKIKTSSFDVMNRSMTTCDYFDKVDLLFETSKTMMEKLLPLRVRLIGVSVSNFYVQESRPTGTIASYFPLRSSSSSLGVGLNAGISTGNGVSVSGDDVVSLDDIPIHASCPICEKQFTSLSLLTFNAHIDECLTIFSLREEKLKDTQSNGESSRTRNNTAETSFPADFEDPTRVLDNHNLLHTKKRGGVLDDCNDALGKKDDSSCCRYHERKKKKNEF